MITVRWLGYGEWLAQEHVRRQLEDGPNRSALAALHSGRERDESFRKMRFAEMTDLDLALALAYAMAACAYLTPTHARRFSWTIPKGDKDPNPDRHRSETWSEPWRIVDHGLWAGGNPFSEGAAKAA